MKTKSILIVDDEASVRESLDKALSKAGYATRTAKSGKEALAVLAESSVDLILSDVRMPDVDGIELLKSIKERFENIEVILITGYGTIETAVEAMKEGAYDFISKPFKKTVILSTIERAIERQNLAQENKYLKSQLGKVSMNSELIGKSQAFQTVLRLVDRVAPLVSTVLITGESGTGKELIAQTIHKRSPRANKKFIPINCAAIPENLIESELFGHMRGAFTGAMRDKQGLFKVASGGTILLDEIPSVPLNLQVKLLRAIEQKEIMPVGSTNPEIIDVRIIAATNKNLEEEVGKGNFREDLYYRLNVFGINIPPLREHIEDIPLLIDHFIRIHNAQLNKNIKGVDDEVLQTCLNYSWKGNVRELENVVERAMILCDGNVLRLEHFSQISIRKGPAERLDSHLKESVRNFEKEAILKALRLANNDKSIAAEKLGMSQSSLYRKMSELGINNKD
ncbi:MAG: sigma-54-dependent transcriptional regulator [bacterium]